MALLNISLESPLLGNIARNLTVVYPENPEFTAELPVMYLLTGGLRDETYWSRMSMIEVYVKDLPMITVMPSCEYGYIDWTNDGPQDERHFIEEVIPFIDRVFNTNASKNGRAIGGLSWGGYGALKFALKYPELFCSVVSHSGAVAASRWRDNPDRATYFEPPRGWFFDQMLGLSPAGGKDCLFQLAEQVDLASVPAIRFDCGTEDFLLEENREFAAHLKALGISYVYEEYPGGHEFEYWDIHVQEAIEFHKEQLSIQ